jgi:hypothetical protein
VAKELPVGSRESTLITNDTDDDAELTFDDDDVNLDVGDWRRTVWVEREPARLKWGFLKPRPPGRDDLAELREQLKALGLRLDQIEGIIGTLTVRGVHSFNGRWGEVVFNGADLASVDGATRAWVLSELGAITGLTEIDGGTF